MTKSLTRAARRALLVLAPVALCVIFVSGGSATVTGNFTVCVQNAAVPACTSPGVDSSFNGGQSGATVQVTISNPLSSTGTIDSANINVPAALPIDIVANPTPSATVGSVAVVGQTLQLTGAGILPGGMDTITFAVDTVCDGSGLAWSADASDSSANGFTYDSANSTGTTTNLVPGCHLDFASQPADTQVGQTITDAGASNGNAIEVRLVDQSNSPMSCPLANTVGCGNIAIATNPIDGTGTLTGANAAMSNSGVATFSTLTLSGVASSHLPEAFTLSATAASGFLTASTGTSGSFNLALYAKHCTSGCSFTQALLPGAINSFADLTGGTSFDFMTLSPYSLSTRTLPVGCQNRLDLGVTGFAETDGRNANGTLTLTFYVNMNNIKAKYGKNVGQQFIPMCAGGKPVDPILHKAIDCTTVDGVGGSAHGWTDDSLTAGKFDGKQKQAVCDADGFYWGILGSFQDKKITAYNPRVTAWGSVTIAGATYRSFTITVPAGWDWRSGP